MTANNIPASHAEVEVAKEKLRRARTAAINLMEDALAARRKAEEAEEAVAAAHRQVQSIIDNTTAIIYAFDLEERFVMANTAVAELLNSTPEQMIGKRRHEFMPKDDADWHEANDRQAIEAGSPLEFEEHSQLNGRSITWLTTKFPLRDAQGRIYAVAGISADVSERKKAEDALRESEERFRSVLDNSRDCIYRVNLQTRRYEYISPYAEKVVGFSPDELRGQDAETALAMIHPDDLPAMRAALARLEETGEADAEYRQRAKNGHYRWLSNHMSLTRDNTGRPLYRDGNIRDITEQKHTEDELREAKIAAEEASRSKGQFLANISHELRTPMNAILGMIDVALPKADDPIVKDCLQTARGSADLLLTLLNDLLDTSKIEAGKLELESAPFSLRRVLDQITRVLSVRASERGLTFCCRIPDKTPDGLVGDRTRLQQVLLNLAGNAIKFTERGGVEVSVRTLSQDGEACLEFAVRDTGIGIPQSDLKRIFDPFSQADASTTRRFGGTGLGLSISRTLVGMMGGTIWVESELGKGSTFYFTIGLPLAAEVPPEPESSFDLSTPAVTTLRVLLVEDNPANQKLATYILQERGHAVEVAGDGGLAIRMAQENRYDVILMDVQMPGMDGLEATATIRAREDKGKRVPIIAMTAHAMKGDRERCLAAGMDGYLSKPINPHEMIGLIESLSDGPAFDSAVVAETPTPMETPPKSRGAVFNETEALERCFHSAHMVQEMIQCFFDEVDSLLPQVRAALKKGDLMEVGRLGHRMKGTVVYLGAHPAREAALRVEQICKCSAGTEAEEAIKALECECMALKAALTKHPLTAEPARREQ